MLTAGAVARRLGIPTSTLRSWNRRYGIGPSDHVPGRYRRYTQADITVLATMQRLIAAGMLPSSAAEVARGQAGRTTNARGGRPDAALVGALVQAAHALDTQTAVEVVTRVVERYGPRTAWEHLCRPALGRVEAEVVGTGRCIDVEHVLSWSIQAGLRRVRPAPARAPGAASVVLACAAGELHSLPLEALHAVLAAETGRAVRMLGQDVPVEALRDALDKTGAAAAVLWSQVPATAQAAALRVACDRAATVIAAGPGWAGRRLPRPAVTAASLAEATALLQGS